MAAGVILFAGYWRRWAHTPGTMLRGDGCRVCRGTFGYLEVSVRFVAMGLEYAAYVGISAFLFRSRHFDGR